MDYEMTRKVYGLISILTILGMGISIPMILLNLNTTLCFLWLIMYTGFVVLLCVLSQYVTIDFKVKYRGVAWYKNRKDIINKLMEVKNE